MAFHAISPTMLELEFAPPMQQLNPDYPDYPILSIAVNDTCLL